MMLFVFNHDDKFHLIPRQWMKKNKYITARNISPNYNVIEHLRLFDYLNIININNLTTI